MGQLALHRRSRTDLEALCSLELWTEVGVSFDRSLEILAASSDEWIVQYLGTLPLGIGGVPLDGHALERARARYAQRRGRARARHEGWTARGYAVVT